MLALVSFTSTVYPSLIGTRPPSLLFLSKHIEQHARTFACTGQETRTYTSKGAMETSGGAHPMHRQMFPGEHQRNHQRGFKQPATANTNMHTRTHTHTHMPPDCRGKGQIKWAARTKSVFFGLGGIAALKVNSLSAGADFHRCGSLIYTILVCISPWQGPQPTRRPSAGEPGCAGSFSQNKFSMFSFRQAPLHTYMWTGCKERRMQSSRKKIKVEIDRSLLKNEQ